MAHPSSERSEILISQKGDTSIYHTQANVNASDNSKGSGGTLYSSLSVLSFSFSFSSSFFFVNKFLLNRENICVNVHLEL